MKKFFALLCVAAVVMVHIFNWILCGSDMAILDHTLMTVGLVAAGAAFITLQLEGNRFDEWFRHDYRGNSPAVD